MVGWMCCGETFSSWDEYYKHRELKHGEKDPRKKRSSFVSVAAAAVAMDVIVKERESYPSWSEGNPAFQEKGIGHASKRRRCGVHNRSRKSRGPRKIP